jgi:hypothetical protein
MSFSRTVPRNAVRQDKKKSFMSLEALRTIKDSIESVSSFDSFDRPIFIIAPPRSGSTFLFDSLAMFDELHHLNTEADHIWWRVFPYDDMPYPCDYIGKEHISVRNVRELRRLIYLEAMRNRCAKYEWGRLYKLRYCFGLTRIRYLDKTITNCFHLEFLNHVFPDAHYIVLLRDPWANISSMIEGWGRPEFSTPQLAPIIRQLKAATVESVTYSAPPGWKDVFALPLPQICAWSWRQHVEYALEFVKNKRKDCEVVRYEDLVKDNLQTVCQLATKLGLLVTKSVVDRLKNVTPSRTTVSAARPYKWMTKNREAIESVRAMVEDLAEKIGYRTF